jgi:DNA processing protein
MGTNKLIKDGAKPIMSADDILEEFNIVNSSNIIKSCDETEIIILNLLEKGGMDIEHILQSANLDSNFILTILTRLECKGIIKRVYGNYYILS